MSATGQKSVNLKRNPSMHFSKKHITPTAILHRAYTALRNTDILEKCDPFLSLKACGSAIMKDSFKI